MELLHQLYVKIFGGGAESGKNSSTPRKVVAFGNVLLDRTAKLSDTELLERYQLPLNSRGELDPETLSKITTEACERAICETNPGGSALNTARILKALGTDVLFFGAVGADKTAEELKAILVQSGVETRLETVNTASTGQCICLVHEDNAALYANIGASAKFSIDYLKKVERDETQAFLRPIERKQILYIEGFFVPQREQVCQFIVQNYIRERRRLALNLSATYIVQQNYEHIMNLVRSALFIFGNQNEFQALANLMSCKTLEEMAKRLLQENGPKVIVITKGADGVDLITNFVDEYSEPGEISFQSYNAPRVENVVDTTGAGDAFVAAFLHAWLEKRSLSECVRVASDVAAKVVTQIGCNLP